MWVYTNNKNHVLAINASDMSGNDGWQEIDSDVIDSALEVYDVCNSARYELVNGEIVERSAADRKADHEMITY